VLLESAAHGVPPPPSYDAKYGSALRRSLGDLPAAALARLRALPPSLAVDLAGVRVHLFHGAPWDPLLGRVYPDFATWERFDEVDADVVLLGHTHYPLVKHQGGRLIVNPGSVGQPRDRGSLAAYAVVDLATGEATIHRVPFDPAPLIADARRHDAGLAYLEEVLTR
jgi:diadenosine tetraphosphatase ApaH/serine/threonine PP2A family protein phosphatase